MLLCPIRNEVEQDRIRRQIIHHGRHFRLLHLKLRTYATPITNRTLLGRIEYGSQAIRNSSHATILFPVRIIDLLDATTTRDIVFTHRDFHFSIIRQVTRSLHQPLTKRTLSHQHGTIHILQRSRYDLSGGSRTSIDQYSQRHYRIQRLRRGSVRTIPLLDLSFR